VHISKIFAVIRFDRFAKWKCILPSMEQALLRQFCNSNCIHLCAHITLSSTSNVKVNIVEWLVSTAYLLCKCSLILLSTFALAQLEEITPLMRMLFMHFLQCLGFRAVVSTWGLFACFVWVARAFDKYIHKYFYILYLVGYMEPLFAIPKTMGLPGSSAVNNFFREGLVNDLVSH